MGQHNERTRIACAIGASQTVGAAAGISPGAAALHLGPYTVCGIRIPSTWTTGDVTFQVSDDNPETVSDGDATWTALVSAADGTTSIGVVGAVASKTYPLNANDFLCAKRIRPVVPSNATARTVHLIVTQL